MTKLSLNINLKEAKKLKKTKTTIATIALILVLTIAATLVALPIVSAHDPPWEIPTYSYIAVAPNPIGVGQNVFVVIWIYRSPPTSTGVGGDRWHDCTITVTKPDGSIETLGPILDVTSSGFTLYTPNQIGTYTFDFYYSGQVASLYNPETGVAGSNSPLIGDTFLPSSASTIITVQEDPIETIPEYPLPIEYWTRPIEGQNTEWASIASNWVGDGLMQGSRFQPDGLAPNSPHIMWTMPIEFGGVVGGTTAVPSNTFYTGFSYEDRFSNAIIMYGRLYFNLPKHDDPNDGPYTCVELATGKILWQKEGISPTLGQLYGYDSMNQHGVVPSGVLWQVPGRRDPPGKPWVAYDAFSGAWLYNFTNVPSGTTVYTSKGEIVRYVLNYKGRWLALWTSAALPDSPLVLTPGTGTNAYQFRPIGKNADMSNNYEWNVTIPDLPGSSSPRIVSVIPGDLILGASSVVSITAQWRGTPDPYTLWAISDKPETRGQLLWIKDYPAPAGNITRMFGYQPVDTVNRVFSMTDAETGQRLGYSLDTGELLWGPVGTPYSEANAYQYFSSRQGQVALGNLYIGGYGGELFAYSMTDGTLLWKYNNTNSGVDTPWGNRPTFLSTIADGKVYGFPGEHSPNTPLYKGAKIRCVDAYTGEELWTLTGWAARGLGEGNAWSYVAEGYLVYHNSYDGQIYCIGKGPSATTVSVQDDVVPKGDSILIKGTVTDQSAGTKQDEQAARFPHGVPAVSDESMGPWMEYVYMQKPLPWDVTGVPVKLEAFGADGSYIDIGTVISDGYGMFKKMWTPEAEGEYTIAATFGGSNSYWASYTETAIGVGPAPSPAGPIEPEEPAEAPLITTETAIIAAVIIAVVIGIAAYWALRKRK